MQPSAVHKEEERDNVGILELLEDKILIAPPTVLTTEDKSQCNELTILWVLDVPVCALGTYRLTTTADTVRAPCRRPESADRNQVFTKSRFWLGWRSLSKMPISRDLDDDPVPTI